MTMVPDSIVDGQRKPFLLGYLRWLHITCAEDIDVLKSPTH